MDGSVLAESSAFADLVRPHLTAMAWLAARLAPAADRDDVVQEALTTAWRRHDTFDPARGTRRTWLLAITADQARKAHRRSRPDGGPPADAGYLDAPGDLDLERAVQALPERQRLTVALHYFLDLPVAEVAAVMGCAEGTVKAALSHARTGLRRAVGEEFRWTN